MNLVRLARTAACTAFRRQLALRVQMCRRMANRCLHGRRGRWAGRLGRALLVTAAGAVVAPAAAVGSPKPPTVIGPVSLGDRFALERAGLVPVAGGPAPRLEASPRVRGYGGGRAIDPQGRLVLFGKYGWIYRGPDQRHLSVVGWHDVIHDEPQELITDDGGFLFLYEGLSVATDPDLGSRWSSPLFTAPVALAPGGVLYALGAAPAVVDVATGRPIAALAGLPAYAGSSPVVAADGTLRSLLSASGQLSLIAHGPDGRLLWNTPLDAIDATAPTIGPDGTTYLGVRSPGHGGTAVSGELVAIGPDGVLRWRQAIGRAPARPAIDAHGVVWTATSDGSVFAFDARGRRRFQRVIGRPGSAPALYALGDGVLVQDGANTVRLAARPAPQRTHPSPALRVVPSTFGFKEPPFTCVAPAAGRPRTCLYALRAGGEARLTVPVDGTATLRIRRASGGPVLFRQGPYRVLAGENRIRIGDPDSTSGACNAFISCYATPGRYVLQTRIPVGGGRARVLTTTFRVRRSAGLPTG